MYSQFGEMHPRNPYRIPPDFLALAEVYPPLRMQYASGFQLQSRPPPNVYLAVAFLRHKDRRLSISKMNWHRGLSADTHLCRTLIEFHET